MNALDEAIVKKIQLVQDISQALIEHRKAKAAQRECQQRLLEIARSLGFSTEEKSEFQVTTFLDGFLIGNGNIQDFRKNNGIS